MAKFTLEVGKQYRITRLNLQFEDDDFNPTELIQNGIYEIEATDHDGGHWFKVKGYKDPYAFLNCRYYYFTEIDPSIKISNSRLDYLDLEE